MTKPRNILIAAGVVMAVLAAVRSSVWLGGIDWKLVGLWARFISILMCQAVLLVMLYFEIRFICKWCRETRENNRKQHNRHSKPDEHPG